jgi:hypothetical protein
MAARKEDDNINLYSLGKIFNKLHDELIKTLAQQARDKIKNKKKNTIQTLLDFKEKSKFYYVPQEHNQPGQQPKPYGYTTPEAEKFKHEYNNKLSDILSKIKAKDLEKFIFKDDTKELYNIIQDLNASDVSTDVSYDDSQRYAPDYNREFFFNLPEFEGTPEYTFHRNLDQNKFENIVKMISEINNYNKLIKDSTQILKRNFELVKPLLDVMSSGKSQTPATQKITSRVQNPTLNTIKITVEGEAAPYLTILANTREKLIGKSEGATKIIGESEGATKIIQNIKQTCEELRADKCKSQTNDTYINNLCTRMNTLSANADRLSRLELKWTDYNANNIVLKYCGEVLENYITVFEIYYNFFLLDCIENSSRINPDIITTYLREYMSKKTPCGKICLKCSHNMIIAPTPGVNDSVEFMRLPEVVLNEKTQKKCGSPPEDDNFKTFKVFMYYCYYKNPGVKISADEFIEKVKNHQTSEIFELGHANKDISNFIDFIKKKSKSYAAYLNAKEKLLETFKKNENNSDLIEKIKQNYNIMRTNYEELYKQLPVESKYQMSKKLSLQHSMINFIIELDKSLRIIDVCRHDKTSSREVIIKLIEISHSIVSKKYYEDIAQAELDYTIKNLIKDINAMMAAMKKKNKTVEKMQELKKRLIYSIPLLNDLLSHTEYTKYLKQENWGEMQDFLKKHGPEITSKDTGTECENIIHIDYNRLHTYVNEKYTIYKKKLAELLHGPDPKLVDPSATSAAASSASASASANAFPPIKIENGEITLTYPFEDESVNKVFAKFDSILSDRTKIDNINKLYKSLTKSSLLSKCWQYMLIQDVINDPKDSPRIEFLCRLGAMYIVNSTQPDQKPIPLYSHDADKCPVSSMCKVCLNTDFFRKAFNLNKNQAQQQPSSFEDYVTNFIIYNPVPYHRHDSPKCPYYNSSYPAQVSKDSHEPSSGSKPKPDAPDASSQTQETPYGLSGRASRWWDDNTEENNTKKAGPAPNIGNTTPSPSKNKMLNWTDPSWFDDENNGTYPKSIGKQPNPNVKLGKNNNNNNHEGGSRTMKKNVFNKKTKTKLQKTRKHKKK